MRDQLGIHAPNIYTLLGYDSLVEFPNWRELICEEVGGYIERTEIQRNKGPESCTSLIFFPIIYFRSLFDIDLYNSLNLA